MTTNEIKSFAANNQYIQMYLNDYETRGKYIYSKIGKNPLIDNGRIDLNTSHRNSIYCKALNEFNRKFNSPNTHKHIKFNFESIDFSGWLNININGSCCFQINAAKYNGESFYKLPFIDDFYANINILGCLSESSVISQAKVYINQFLYSPGFFRDVQICNYWNKERAKDALRRFYKRPLLSYDDKEVEAWIKRHLNIDLSMTGLSERALNYCKKYGKHNKPSILHFMPDPFDILDGCEDDNIEGTFYDYMSEYPQNSVFC